jgi:phosphoglucomutase
MNKSVDPLFAFMTVDHDGKIRMDCSSSYAMASLVKLKMRTRSPLPMAQIRIGAVSSRLWAG